MDEIVQFGCPADSPKVLEVIGAGGGGGIAVTHMYREGIHDVTFVLCNTDNQALAESPVPVKLQLGRSIYGLLSIYRLTSTSGKHSNCHYAT